MRYRFVKNCTSSVLRQITNMQVTPSHCMRTAVNASATKQLAAIRPISIRQSSNAARVSKFLSLHDGNTTHDTSRKATVAHFKESTSPDDIVTQPTISSTTGQTTGRNIVLAVDDTSESHMAVQWAVDNLLRSGDVVHLFQMAPGIHEDHVFSTPSGHLVKVNSGMHDREQSATKQDGASKAHQLLEKYGPQFSTLQVMLHAHLLPVSRPFSKTAIGQALCDQADGLGAAAVVVASHSHGGLSEFIRGSVADYAARHCNSPVAVLHSKPGGQEKGGSITTGNLKAAGSRQILLAVEDSEDSLEACQWVLDNMYHEGDMLHLVHVVPCLPLSTAFTGSDFLVHMGLEDDPDLLQRQRAMAEEEAAAWQTSQSKKFGQIVEQAGAKYTFDVLVQYTENPVDAISGSICSLAEELDASAVVLSHHERPAIVEWVMGSVSGQITHHCTAPVVVLHTGANATQRTASPSPVPTL